MILNERGILKECDLTIYPMPFVIAIGDVEEEINRRYLPSNPNYSHIGKCQDAAATTYQLKSRRTGDYRILVWVYDINDFKSSVICHECCHAALEIFHYVGAKVQFDNQEPFCYLSGTLSKMAVGAFYKLKDFKEKQKPVEEL